MRKPALVVVPLLLAALLGGCAAGSDEPPSDPVSDLEKVIDLIPWAKSIAADASADELTARITEITADLGSLDIRSRNEPRSRRNSTRCTLRSPQTRATPLRTPPS